MWRLRSIRTGGTPKFGTWLIWQKYYLRRGGWSTLGTALERADVRERRWIGGPGDRVMVSQLGREMVVVVVVVVVVGVVGWSRK